MEQAKHISINKIKSLFVIKGDKVLWTIIAILCICSLLSTYTTSGSIAYTSGQGTFFYLIKQIIILAFGFVIFIFFYNIAFKKAYSLSKIGLIISAILLVISIIFGTTAGEAARWLSIPGVGLTIQPSELALFTLIVVIAGYISINYEKIDNFTQFWTPILILITLFFILIFLNGISMSLLMLVSCGGLLFIGGAKIKHIIMLVGALLLITVAVYIIAPSIFNRLETASGRLEATKDKTVDINNLQQIDYSKAAIASGGIIGNMPGKSLMRNRLASSQNDFIYAIIIEEYGFIGGAFIGLLYLILFYRGVKIGAKSESRFGACVSVGLSFCLVTRAMINMGVATGVLPVTGQPLPLLSAGGTSTWVTMAMLGLIMNISRNHNNSEEIEIQVQEETPEVKLKQQ